MYTKKIKLEYLRWVGQVADKNIYKIFVEHFERDRLFSRPTRWRRQHSIKTSQFTFEIINKSAQNDLSNNKKQLKRIVCEEAKYVEMSDARVRCHVLLNAISSIKFLSPQSRVLEKLTVGQPAKKFIAFTEAKKSGFLPEQR